MTEFHQVSDNAHPQITLVVTSCGRVDLLCRTLDSLNAEEPWPFVDRIIVEDSGDQDVIRTIQERFSDYRILANPEQLGQMRSIDRAYGEVQTPYIFHCEDDWLFTGGPFVEAALHVLETDPMLSCVCVRRVDEIAEKYHQSAPPFRIADVDALRIDPKVHPEWFGYGFNPSLVRLETYRRFGPFSAYGTEAEISYRFKAEGFTTAYLVPGHAQHVGDGQHVVDPFQPKRPTGFLSRLQHSLAKRIKRLQRKLPAS